MAKLSAEYFSHDTDASQDEKIIYLESLFGDSGYAWFFKMLETLGRSNNFEIEWNELKCGVLARKFNTTQQEFNKFIVAATNPDVRAFVIENGRLYSPGLKNRLEKMLERRRKEAERIAEKRAKYSVDATKSSVAPTSTQSKVKESKVKESKEESKNAHDAAENSADSEPKKNVSPQVPAAPPQKGWMPVDAAAAILTDVIAQAEQWMAKNPDQCRLWVEIARFDGDIKQETAKFFSHYWRETGQHHKCRTEPIRFFCDGFPGWLINAKAFNRQTPGSYAPTTPNGPPQRATIMHYQNGRPALKEKQKF